MMVILGRLFAWRDALVNVQPDTFLRWHRKGFRVLWRWKSRPVGRARPKDLRRLIQEMAAENPTWGEERIANELNLKLTIQLSPRTVGKYLRRQRPVRTPDPKQRWLTFVCNHAKVMVACDFFVVITAAFQTLYVVPHCNRLAPLFEDPWTPSKGKLTPSSCPDTFAPGRNIAKHLAVGSRTGAFSVG